MRKTPAEIKVYPDPVSLARAAVGIFTTQAESVLATGMRFSVALAGGSTPRLMYSMLIEDIRAINLDWSRVHLFWSDERCVSPEHIDSNYRLARENMLDRLSIPAENIHRLRGELDPSTAALEYERLLRDFFTDQSTSALRESKIEDHKTFDLVLLGLGLDGHTASLFPGSLALGEMERWVAAVEHHQPPPPLVNRLTLTLPVINAASLIIFLVSGPEKATILRQVLARPSEERPPLPAQLVQPTAGQLIWLLDTNTAPLDLRSSRTAKNETMKNQSNESA
jgi:6-phosphogluconolactonase